MTTNRQGIIAALMLLALAIGMGFVHFMATGINEQFGMGFTVGMLFTAGCIFLASRDARHIP